MVLGLHNIIDLIICKTGITVLGTLTLIDYLLCAESRSQTNSPFNPVTNKVTAISCELFVLESLFIYLFFGGLWRKASQALLSKPMDSS